MKKKKKKKIPQRWLLVDSLMHCKLIAFEYGAC